MKLNLGCGLDRRNGYVNVDFHPRWMVFSDIPVHDVDLSIIPWPWPDSSAEEILMLDFLEHFPYRKTDQILQEAWRILKPGGFVDIQVPDFDECAAAMMFDVGMLCNVCGFEFGQAHFLGNERVRCAKCDTSIYQIAESAMQRLYGGQDYQGNWHFAAFTKNTLTKKLSMNGFWNIEPLEEEHQRKNWNFKFRAFKKNDLWGSDD